MTAQLLIYESAVPVSSGRHRKCCVDMGAQYAFARKINAVPLLAVEFQSAATEYAVVFAPVGDAVVPVAMLGARNGENLYLGSTDQWQAKYIPAFVRRYPFVFATTDEGKTFTLCVDEAFQGLNYLGKGQALFDADDQPTAYVREVLQFQQEYHAQNLRTEAFCKRLQELDLLQPMTAQFTLDKGENVAIGGFMIVDRDRLKALSDADLAWLARSDGLELIHTHLQSVRNFNEVKVRLGGALPAAPTGAVAAAATTTS
jgi:hypothetical protein